jgi:hypothetical protein
LNIINLYENWDVKGTGVTYYNQITLLQEILKTKSTLIQSKDKLHDLGNWTIEISLKSNCFENKQATFGLFLA